ncbi:hypothetical protein HYU40_02925 [Candidatus Woesearchaeota archaeon]|nr:hypothetical protein [Candidatus Woesearchaeota archaeon]
MLKGLNNWKILNSKEVKELAAMAKQQWGCELSSVVGDAAFLEEATGDIFLISRDVERLDLERLRIDSLGLYFGEKKNGELRLSIEGSQLVGKSATKNVLEISDSEFKDWIRGSDLEKDYGSCSGYAIIKHAGDFVGCGRCKGGTILNFVPKARRIANI